jgi:hypothetical protein
MVGESYAGTNYRATLELTSILQTPTAVVCSYVIDYLDRDSVSWSRGTHCERVVSMPSHGLRTKMDRLLTHRIIR